MNIQTKLPDEVIDSIKDILWGNIDSWKKKFNIVLRKDFLVIKRDLKPSPYCIFSGNLLEIEDEIFCSSCGEKTIFPFTRSICETCEYYESGGRVVFNLNPQHQYF